MDENEKQKMLETGIGDKEAETLEAKPVVVQGITFEEVDFGDKGGKSTKVVLISKHPDREDPLHISKVRYLKGDKVKSSGLWYNIDEDEKIIKNSALAVLLGYYKKDSLKQLEGEIVTTEVDSDGYLIIKAY